MIIKRIGVCVTAADGRRRSPEPWRIARVYCDKYYAMLVAQQCRKYLRRNAAVPEEIQRKTIAAIIKAL